MGSVPTENGFILNKTQPVKKGDGLPQRLITPAEPGTQAAKNDRSSTAKGGQINAANKLIRSFGNTVFRVLVSTMSLQIPEIAKK